MNSPVIVFRNPGAIDPATITTFGVSVKVGASPIGYFGTGLKYALSILLRTGHAVTIWSGLERMEFGLENRTVRGAEFQYITMNGEALGFTTDVGKKWEVWQALRELYCNCSDESGAAGPRVDPTPAPDTTVIEVRGAPMYDEFSNLDRYILRSKPLVELPGMEIHPGPSRAIFYRGVKIADLPEEALFKYNILRKIDLTEDRTAKYWFEIPHAVVGGLAALTDRDTIRSVLTATSSKAWEKGLDWSGTMPTPEVLETICELARAFDRNLNPTALHHAFVLKPEIMAKEVPELALDPVDEARLRRSVAFCKLLGYPVDDYPIKVVEDLGENVLGRALGGSILLSRSVLTMGTKMVAGTLMEEFFHLRHRVVDETRTMQNFLINEIVGLGERIAGEPL